MTEATTPPSSAPQPASWNDTGWFGHPRQLARLFTTEMWERFGFYGMRALLTLYLTKHFLFSDTTTNGLYGGFAALVYLTPLIGGLIADRVLGSKRSVKYGAILMSLGYFVLCFGGQTARPHADIAGQHYEVVSENAVDRPTSSGLEKLYRRSWPAFADQGQRGWQRGPARARRACGAHGARRPVRHGGTRSSAYVLLMLLGLSLVAVGNGSSSPTWPPWWANSMPPATAAMRVSRSSTGINLGSLFSQILCPWLADAVGWWAGFAGGDRHGGGLDADPVRWRPPRRLWRAAGQQRRDLTVPIYLGALVAVGAVILLFQNLIDARPVGRIEYLAYVIALPLLGKILFASFLIGCRRSSSMHGAAAAAPN
jgi:POT family proton-dependent oligopeptide transporter